MAEQVKRGCYLLGEYRLEPEKRLLSCREQQVHLAKRPLQVLLYLIEHHERIVSRAELLERFWDGKDVYDETLGKAVSAIRKALGDRKGDPHFIETHWAGGYRYIGPLEEQPLPSEPFTVEIERTRGIEVAIEEIECQPAVPEEKPVTQFPLPAKTLSLSAPPLSRRAMALVLALAVIVLSGFILSTARRHAASAAGETAPPRSIAVLPLRNLSGDPANDYLSDGMTESLISALSKINGLKVISRNSVFTFKGTEIDPREAGRRLGVATVLEGSLRRNGDRIRVDARLVSAADGRVLWASDTYNHALGDIFTVEDEVARGITSGLLLKLSGQQQEQVAVKPTTNAEAYQAYMRGRYFLEQRSPEGLSKARDYFEQAIRIDPSFALAYAGLAYYYCMAVWGFDPRPQELMAKGHEAAAKALALDDRLAEAHVAMGLVTRDWAQAEREYQRAIDLDPSDAEAYHRHAYSLVYLDRGDEAIADIKRAQELDPLSVVMNVDVGEILIDVRHYDQAIEALKKAIEMDPNRSYAHFDLAVAYEQKGMFREAVKEYIKNLSLIASWDPKPEWATALQQAYDTSGEEGYLRKELALLKEKPWPGSAPAMNFALIYAQLGEKDQAFEWLEKLYRDGSPVLDNVKIYPQFDSLRSDPRYADLLRRIGLPQ